MGHRQATPPTTIEKQWIFFLQARFNVAITINTAGTSTIASMKKFK